MTFHEFPVRPNRLQSGSIEERTKYLSTNTRSSTAIRIPQESKLFELFDQNFANFS